MAAQVEKYRVAVIDDQQNYLDDLCKNLERYAQERHCEFLIQSSTSVVDFVSDYAADYDIIFLDVIMPDLDGIAAASRIRQLDNEVCIIFVTNYAQYAIHGYEVQAFSYILKPFLYGNFALTMDKTLRYCRTRQNDDFVLQTPDGFFRFPIRELIYVESQEHTLVYHSLKEDIRKRGKLSDAEKALKDRGFCRCGVSFLVNLRCIKKIENQTVSLNDGSQLVISRRYKTAFLAEFAAFIGRGGAL